MTSRLSDHGSRHERHLGIAADLSGQAPEEIRSKFKRSRVVITGHPETLASRRGRIMLLTAANLISRFCPRIDVAIPATLQELRHETLRLLQSIDSSPEAEFRILETPNSESEAALAIGPIAENLPNLTSIDSYGWRAFVRQGPQPPSDAIGCEETGNPFGALVAAALGTAEVFKHLLNPLSGKAFLLGTATFSAYDYSVSGNEPGPSLPTEIRLPRSLLVGVGAVGNALLLALSYLPSVSGDLMVVDNQTVDKEGTNLNRYVLGTEADAKEGKETPKTELAVRLFRGSTLRIDPQQRPLEEVLDRIHLKELPRPEIVLSAVDNNDSRYLLQKLWPDLVLEGATDRTLAQVSRHEYGRDLACLMCIHSSPEGRHNAIPYLEAAAARTGLSPVRIQAAERDASLTIQDGDIDAAPSEQQKFLAERLGRPICGVLTETASISKNPEAPPQVAVSFTSLLAGVLQASELIKYAAGCNSILETMFQIDPMFPLENAALQPVRPSKNCYCRQRESEIKKYRSIVTDDRKRG